ncbi:DUF1549 and DUF1553 domain-containing protein [Lignipirellula cremea]|uniref:Planctomycete cytochrome C n=1 Tax=Lignipirellula cremea TaxID=2528010 RepID=A0A518DVT1_9BACT|nr:DUF1549 and DUF1553 domain-containing protein [Lignipirellula cremea]QDU95939.1 hypothetical protein Pla8534_37580 [Lignipirellula cremea]
MFRAGILALAAALLGSGGTFADERPFAQPPLSESDPLFEALQKLQREINELRGEVRGVEPRSRTTDVRPAEPMPAMSPTPDPQDRPRLPLSSEPTAPATTSVRSALPPISLGRTTSDHWAFQPLATVAPPTVKQEAWPRDDLDRFILAGLEQARLTPNADADRYALIRRLAFDLTGLPPTAAEIRDFVDDPDPLDTALARQTDRYLASPRFGERWGRHWLDVARYADSVGRNWNAPFTYAWRYRDYVIDAMNDDTPYDQFITEQLAGDLLPASDLPTRRKRLVATGYLALGPIDIIEPAGETLEMDRIDEQIDVVTRGMLGLTVSCARCHDHKYEPISMRDYYALAGVFYSTHTLSGQRRGNYVADDVMRLLPTAGGSNFPVTGIHSMADVTHQHRQGGYREVLFSTDPNLAMGAEEGAPQDCPIRLDGEAYRRGEVPPRGDFQIAGLGGLGQIPSDVSGRQRLAQWIVAKENPLAARVMVNRVWRHLLGQGLVGSVDNFGVSGESPSHPELLDHLAVRFQQDWSIKSLIRAVVLSRTYRLSSNGQPAGQATDPQNRHYWRVQPKRLEVEALRDAMLTAAGRLTYDRPPGIQIAGTGGKGRWGVTRSLLGVEAPYRTVYLPVLRSLLPDMYRIFDFPDPSQLMGQREVTTVAPQALFLMNSDFAVNCSDDIASQLLNAPGASDADRVQRLYMRLLSRPAEASEVDAARTMMARLEPPSGGRTSDELYRWSALVQALMISGEFRTLL